MSAATGYVVTVTGAIAADRLGRTLVHEHLYMDAPSLTPAIGEAESMELAPDALAKVRWDPGLVPENVRFTDVDLVVDELSTFTAAAGRTIVDLTPIGYGRDPARLVEISERSGVNVVMGGGYFLEAFHPPGLASKGIEEIADELIREVRDGAGDTGVRPGVLGEIGTGDPLTDEEARLLRAHALASIETEIPLNLHIHPWGWEGERVARILLDAGVDPRRIALGHLNTAVRDDEYVDRLAALGVYLQFDLFGFDHSLLGAGRYPPSDWDVAGCIARLVRDGYAERILLSHDIGELIRLRHFGGFGYGHVFTNVLPLLVELGISATQAEAFVTTNPASYLARSLS